MSDDSQIPKTDEEWREALSPDEYRVARQKGTEAPFTGRYWDCKSEGTYLCVGCGQPLYSSKTKFDSGSGWPSFYAPADESAVVVETDTSHGMIRSELACRRCGSHLGHVFDDGPAPTGKRHCINSASLRLKKASGEDDDQGEVDRSP